MPRTQIISYAFRYFLFYHNECFPDLASVLIRRAWCFQAEEHDRDTTFRASKSSTFQSILHMDDFRFDWHKGYQSISPSDPDYWWSRSSYADQKFDEACPTKKYNMHWRKIITISVRSKKIVMTIRQLYLKTTLTFLSQGNTRVLLKLAETSNLSMYSLGFHKGNQSKLTYTVDTQQRGGSIIYDKHRSFILRCRKSKDHLLLFSVADINLCCMLYYCMI